MRNRLNEQEFLKPQKPADQRTERRLAPERDARRAVVRGRTSGVFQGTIADVSFSGIALILDDVSGLSVGEAVELLYRSDRVPATVKYIVPADAGYRVGLQVGIES
jgi:hypothetical protein